MLKLPKNTNRDLTVMLWSMIPFAIVLNSIIFGASYFSSLKVFLIASPVTFIILAFSFILYGQIAISFRQRFPGDQNFLRRTLIMILLFLTMSALLIFALYQLYDVIQLSSQVSESSFTWAYIITGIFNIFLTFLNEGIYRFERWKSNLEETEKLKITYKQSQLIGLKSQVNPHFLFNSLNSLSGLIQEDKERAEKFLDEMSKVYRYMLRNDDEQLVTVATEIQFINSYFSLLKDRYGNAVHLNMTISDADREKMIPPLSMQVIIENALYQNKTSKDSPLVITISSTNDNAIIIKNNIQRKILTETGDQETGLDNLIRKYQLMSDRPVDILDRGNERIIVLPLIKKSEEVEV